jgi:hypothetical protein
MRYEHFFGEFIYLCFVLFDVELGSFAIIDVYAVYRTLGAGCEDHETFNFIFKIG